jgi:hypothetical protein
MKIINLPTFAEYHSSRNGCGLNYTTYYKKMGGRYRQNLEALYYSHCALLCHYANEYLNGYINMYCKYFDIELATNEINIYAKRRTNQNNRTKMR